MQLSDAIRLGAMMKPQAFDTQFDGVGTCANGAALDAVGQLGPLSAEVIGKIFPITRRPMTMCPMCRQEVAGFSRTLGGVVAHLNDEHRWTREQIADWVANCECFEQPLSVGAEDWNRGNQLVCPCA